MQFHKVQVFLDALHRLSSDWELCLAHGYIVQVSEKIEFYSNRHSSKILLFCRKVWQKISKSLMNFRHIKISNHVTGNPYDLNQSRNN